MTADQFHGLTSQRVYRDSGQAARSLKSLFDCHRVSSKKKKVDENGKRHGQNAAEFNYKNHQHRQACVIGY